MKRIQGTSVAPDLHGAGKSGFKDGNKTLGILATIVNALFMNQTQEEILSVIEASGRTPDDTNQLLPSILSLIKGGDYKDSVRFTTTANIVLSGLGTQAGGDWPAALTAGERILVKNQGGVAAHVDNGEYIAAVGAWTRATDADTGAEFNSGAIIPVESGTLNADTNWQLTTDGTVIIGTTALTFTQMPSQLASNAEILSGVVANKSVSPLGLLQGLLGLGGAAANDYITIPYRDKTDGSRKNLIIQWGGVSSVTEDAFTALTFNITFPTSVFAIFAFDKRNAALTGANSGGCSGEIVSTSAFRIYAHSTGLPLPVGHWWLAIGN